LSTFHRLYRWFKVRIPPALIKRALFGVIQKFCGGEKIIYSPLKAFLIAPSLTEPKRCALLPEKTTTFLLPPLWRSEPACSFSSGRRFFLPPGQKISGENDAREKRLRNIFKSLITQMFSLQETSRAKNKTFNSVCPKNTKGAYNRLGLHTPKHFPGVPTPVAL